MPNGDYLHGAYGQAIVSGDKASAQSKAAPIYVGSAPVHTVAGGKKNLNKPVVVKNFAEAQRLFGYSEDWASYTLCEAMYVHLVLKGIGPLVLINCLDVDACKVGESQQTLNVTPANGRAVIEDAEAIILDSVKVGTKVLGTDYSIAYDSATKRITIAQAKPGALGTAPLAISYDTIDPSGVTEADISGETDGEGRNTGLYAVQDVYQATGFIPTLLLVPGFSCIPAVHKQMLAVAQKVNGHWDPILWSDIPLLNGQSRMTMDGAAAWKQANGYDGAGEKVFYPMAEGTDGRVYHLSVLACANKQALDAAANGVPYQSASNTEAKIIKNLYFGEDDRDRRIDDATINEKLNKNGITSAAFVGGRWVIWGPHAAQYTVENGTKINVFDTTMQMLFYITNDFQNRRATEIDQPMTKNRLDQIVAEERTRIDALISTGALIFGEVYLAATGNDREDMANGDFKFKFNVTTTPLSKSMTAMVSWTDKGFETYFGEEA